MGLREEAIATTPPLGPPRRLPGVLQELGDEAAEFELLLSDPSIAPSALCRILERRDIKVSRSTVHSWCRERRHS